MIRRLRSGENLSGSDSSQTILKKVSFAQPENKTPLMTPIPIRAMVVVEPDPNLLEFYRRMYSRMFPALKIDYFQEATMALAYLSAHPGQIGLMSTNLYPCRDGRTVKEFIAAARQSLGAEIPVLLVTASPDYLVKVEGIANIQPILQPFSVDNFVKTVKQLIEQSENGARMADLEPLRQKYVDGLEKLIHYLE